MDMKYNLTDYYVKKYAFLQPAGSPGDPSYGDDTKVQDNGPHETESKPFAKAKKTLPVRHEKKLSDRETIRNLSPYETSFNYNL